MQCSYACTSPEHFMSRRQFLAGMTTGALGFGGLVQAITANELAKSQKRVLLFFLAGGLSQLESWDPKPGTDTGGPFHAIRTSVPGIHVCELLPYTAQQMHRLALIRGVDTAENNHAQGAYLMQTGRRQGPAMDYPHLGSAVAKLLVPAESLLPGYVHINSRGEATLQGKSAAGFLGSKYGPVVLANGKPPANLNPTDALTEDAERQRQAFREHLNQRFAQSRRTAETEAYTQSYEQAAQLMQRREIFDLNKESPHDLERYGTHNFGRHCLLARRLLQHGLTFVQVTHSNYDTHHENFDFHIEQLGEFDRPFATLLDDLAQCGLLASTLVIVMSEFGRTPKINEKYGRDHWSAAWSVALAGCGIQAGGVVGKTNANGTAVTQRKVTGGDLFHTYFRALGLNPLKKYFIRQQPIPMADPEASAIQEVLA
jgi:uncharacterized protein (DUF1501 family)